MEVVLEVNGLKKFIDKDVPKTDVAETVNLDAWKKKVAKERRILLEGVQTTFSQTSMGNPHHMQCGRL
jgi:hypothetical protein